MLPLQGQPPEATWKTDKLVKTAFERIKMRIQCSFGAPDGGSSTMINRDQYPHVLSRTENDLQLYLPSLIVVDGELNFDAELAAWLDTFYSWC